jgi:RND family efflux transporter MFP subunit
MSVRSAVLLGLVGLAACKPAPADPHDHAHDEAEPVQATVWSPDFEIFVDHPPIVVGSPVEIAVHVTELATLAPRKEGGIALTFRGPDGAALDRAEAKPRQPGIYVPTLSFPASGTWTASLRVGDRVVELPPFVAHVSTAAAKQAAPAGIPDGITFLKDQQWAAGLKSEPAGKRRLVERLRVPAAVAARPGSRASVAPPAAGRLLAPPGRALPSIGERVAAGQVLALVQPPFADFAARLVEANAESLRAGLAADQAALTLDRVRKLAAAGARTDREVQEAEFALKSARASLDAARRLQAAYERSGATAEGGFALAAPIAGVVVGVHAAAGEHVPSERAVVTILDSSLVHVVARVPEADLALARAAGAALVEPATSRGKAAPFEARLVHAGLEVDPETRTVAYVFEAANPDGLLRIGLALTLHLETARAEEALALPASAIVEEEARPVAFVQAAGETFVKRRLRLGIRDGDWVQVLDGLSPGERVVVKEAFAVRLASVSSAIPAHHH